MFKTSVSSGIFVYVHLKAENHFQPNQMGKSRIGAFQDFQDWGKSRIGDFQALAALSRCLRRFYFLKTGAIFYIKSAWPGLVIAWPGLVMAWPGLVIAWPGLVIAWPGPAPYGPRAGPRARPHPNKAVFVQKELVSHFDHRISLFENKIYPFYDRNMIQFDNRIYKFSENKISLFENRSSRFETGCSLFDNRIVPLESRIPPS